MANTKIFTHKGVDVFVTDQGAFTADTVDRTYETATQIREAIDRQQKRDEAISKKKIALAVVELDGTEHTITGVHARNGNLLAKPPLNNAAYGRSRLYPATQFIIERTKHIGELEAEIEKIKKEIGAYAADITWADYSDGRSDDPISLIEKRYAEALEKCRQFEEKATVPK